MQHKGLFLYPQTRQLVTSTLNMNQLNRIPTFLIPPPPAPAQPLKRRRSTSNKNVSWKGKEGVKVFNYWRTKHKNDIKFREKRVITSTSIHPLRSNPLLFHLVMTTSSQYGNVKLTAK